jgi:hypothetical protein
MAVTQYDAGGSYLPGSNYDRTGSTDNAGSYTSPTITSPTVTGATSKPSVTQATAATVALTAAQSGTTFAVNRASGVVFTLPAPSIGLVYNFIVQTTITSNAFEVDTDAGTTFMQGTIINTKASDGTLLACFGNGTSHVKLSMNGTTTGGVKGTEIQVRCITATVWQVTGTAQGSGTIATPFA